MGGKATIEDGHEEDDYTSMALGAWVDTVACDSPVMHEGHMETGELGHEDHNLGAEPTEHSEGPE